MPGIGKVVWTPLNADTGIRDTSGKRRFSGVGSFGLLRLGQNTPLTCNLLVAYHHHHG